MVIIINNIVSISLSVIFQRWLPRCVSKQPKVFRIFPLPTTSVIQATAHWLFPGSPSHHFLLQLQPRSRPYGFPRQQARQQSGHPLCLRPFAPWMKFSFRSWPSITRPPVIDGESWQAKLRGHLRTVGSGRYFCRWACLAKELRTGTELCWWKRTEENTKNFPDVRMKMSRIQGQRLYIQYTDTVCVHVSVYHS